MTGEMGMKLILVSMFGGMAALGWWQAFQWHDVPLAIMACVPTAIAAVLICIPSDAP